MLTSNSFFLMEQGIRQEPKIVKIDTAREFARWEMVMQDADAPNQNKRIYPKSVLEEGIRDIEDKIQGRSFFGEMDHPLPTGNFDEVRQTTVLLKESSHIIVDYEWRGNLLYGVFESLSTTNGKNAYGLVKDRAAFGTSMRGMAELEHKGEFKVVRGPLYIICYDLVSNPSHKKAVIDEKRITFEALQNISDATSSKVLTESACGKTVCLPNGVCYLADYFDKLVEQRLVKFYDRWI